MTDFNSGAQAGLSPVLRRQPRQRFCPWQQPQPQPVGGSRSDNPEGTGRNGLCPLCLFQGSYALVVFEFRLPRAPTSPLIAVILLGALSAGRLGRSLPKDAPVDREAIPDLNQLQKRVLEFWSLVTRGEKYQALRYVAEGQNHFLNWKWPPVESYRVANLEFKEGSHEVVVTVQAVVRPPGFGTPVNWPVRQQWVFREDTWKILVEGSNLAALFGGTRPETGRFQPGSERRPSKQFKQFRIGKRIHFGKVLQGEVIWDEIPYKNESGIEISVRVSEAPNWIALDRSHFVVPSREPKGRCSWVCLRRSWRVISRGRSPWNWATEKSVTPKRFRCWDRSERPWPSCRAGWFSFPENPMKSCFAMTLRRPSVSPRSECRRVFWFLSGSREVPRSAPEATRF